MGVRLRRLTFGGFLAGASLGLAGQLLLGGPVAPATSAPAEPRELAQLDLLETVLFHVEESYVEPARVDWEAMFRGSLDAVERAAPSVLFSREASSGLLQVQIGAFRQVLEVAPVRTRQQLQAELGRVAELLARHLDPQELEPVPGAGRLARLEHDLINGALSTLDPHTLLLPPEEGREMDVENRGNFGGLGITLREVEGTLELERVWPDTPAARQGLQAGDRLARIDDTSTLNMSLEEAVDLLRGPEGEPVQLQVERLGWEGPRPLTVVRERIAYKPVESQLLDGGVAYVRIQGFHQEVETDLDAALARLHRASGSRLRGLLLDLRGNPGGYLHQAVAVADRFLERGTIVSTVDGSGRRLDRDEAALNGTEPAYPLVVLVDGNSASASEIVAGALRNNERAILVGERTFGKGSVQNLHTFYDDSKLKLTISRYLTPGDRSIQSVGIPVDVELLPTDLAANGARLHPRELLLREADLDRHLAQVEDPAEPAVYRLRHVREEVPESEVAREFTVRLARDLVLASPTPRRAEMLAAAARVIQSYRAQQDQQVAQGLTALGLDWTPAPKGTVQEAPRVEVRLEPVGEDHLLAGAPTTLAARVTNLGSASLHRLSALVVGDGPLAGTEFHFGLLKQGATASAEASVQVPAGLPAQTLQVPLAFFDASDRRLVQADTWLEVAPRPLPRLAWAWRAEGPEVVAPGAEVALTIEVTNVGEGAAEDALVKLRNTSGKAVDLHAGLFRPGQGPDGQPCLPGDSACRPTLLPGQSASSTFSFTLTEHAAGDVALELLLSDRSAYDWGAVVDAGLEEAQLTRERLVFEVGQALPAGGRREPPALTLSRSPPFRSASGLASLSGSVNDDQGVASVAVYLGSDKVMLQSEVGVSPPFVPFQADLPLEPGRNPLTIVARDNDGWVTTRSLVVWNEATPPVALKP